MVNDKVVLRGRFAPTPSGRMHLGNVFAALLAWLDVSRAGGQLVLRIEDLDSARCSHERAEVLLDDLLWLGLDWDEGGLTSGYIQSERSAVYQAAFERLLGSGLVYPCFCTRAERLAASAPHREDGSVVYNGRCRELSESERVRLVALGRKPAWRVRVPDEVVSLHDGNLGEYAENLAADCGDFILRRSDGVFAYQLAVVVDDGEMGINRVVRGRDLISSAPRQIWLHRELGYQPPEFCHVPLLLAEDGRRLAKRDRDLDMGALREKHSSEEIIGLLAWWSGLQNEYVPLRPAELVSGFSWDRVAKEDIVARLPEDW
jgi:glutamyl-tRNA synthetase